MKPLSHLLSQINDPQQMESVLLAVLTGKEREAIRNRLQIIDLLAAKKTHREIATILGVGIATVTRGAQAMKDGKFDVLQPFFECNQIMTEHNKM